jgi:hypothetical protein
VIVLALAAAAFGGSSSVPASASQPTVAVTRVISLSGDLAFGNVAVGSFSDASGQSPEPVPDGATVCRSLSWATSVGFPSCPSHEMNRPSGPLCNLEIPDTMKPIVARMWKASPTFRRQCARLTEASLTVTVWLGFPKEIEGANAVTRIQVLSGTPHAVKTRLRIGQPEYLAHEIEHVLEQIDGVNLRWAVEQRLDGVHLAPGDQFETTRAAAVGRLVAEEVRRAGK